MTITAYDFTHAFLRPKPSSQNSFLTEKNARNNITIPIYTKIDPIVFPFTVNLRLVVRLIHFAGMQLYYFHNSKSFVWVSPLQPTSFRSVDNVY